MDIEIWSLGSKNELMLDDAIRQYLSKANHWLKTELILLQVPKKLSSALPEVMMKAEEELITNRLKPYHYLILLDERGSLLSSTQWAETFSKLMNQATKTLVLLIGGSYGVTATIKALAKQTWSLSALVFPHQLVRLIVAEQVYRALSIINNSQYHHM